MSTANKQWRMIDRCSESMDRVVHITDRWRTAAGVDSEFRCSSSHCQLPTHAVLAIVTTLVATTRRKAALLPRTARPCNRIRRVALMFNLVLYMHVTWPH